MAVGVEVSVTVGVEDGVAVSVAVSVIVGLTLAATLARPRDPWGPVMLLGQRHFYVQQLTFVVTAAWLLAGGVAWQRLPRIARLGLVAAGVAAVASLAANNSSPFASPRHEGEKLRAFLERVEARDFPALPLLEGKVSYYDMKERAAEIQKEKELEEEE